MRFEKSCDTATKTRSRILSGETARIPPIVAFRSVETDTQRLQCHPEIHTKDFHSFVPVPVEGIGFGASWGAFPPSPPAPLPRQGRWG
jgi:hypothetical protein